VLCGSCGFEQSGGAGGHVPPVWLAVADWNYALVVALCPVPVDVVIATMFSGPSPVLGGETNRLITPVQIGAWGCVPIAVGACYRACRQLRPQAA
jgi:hypothetical protein